MLNFFNWLNDAYIGPALPLVVPPLGSSRQSLAAFIAHVQSMLGPTHLGREEGRGCLPGVVVRPDLTLLDQAVEAGYIRVALALVPIQVASNRELVVGEAAGEPGARLPPREPLLLPRLAETAAELH